MKIYILDPIHEFPLFNAKNAGEVVKWDDENINDWSNAEAIIVRTHKITKEKMLQAPNLKIIAKHGIGTDNIDLKAAKELGIVVTNTPQANMESVAELVVSLALSCARKIPKSYDMIKQGIEKLSPKELTGMELSGKTVGLIGIGRIGSRVGSILKNGFCMEVIGYDGYVNEDMFNKLGIKKIEDLNELLIKSDVINISVPLTPSTENLIDEAELKIMKKNAVLINCARGKIVNEKALYEALRTGEISAAALDVFETEPPAKDNPLFTLDNFIGTPHIGAATEEALINMGQTALEEIIRVRDGKKPLYIVNK